MPKVLVVRFSSIGDIVLTSPVLRMLKSQTESFEVHFLTKKQFLACVQYNPNIDKIFTIEKEIDEVLEDLKTENYDFIIDLHNNLRSRRLSFLLKVKTKRFHKLNFKKWLSVQFKINLLPDIHVVDRYLASLKDFGFQYENVGLDYFIDPKDEEIIKEIEKKIGPNYFAFVVGGTYQTKQIPNSIFKMLIDASNLPIVLLGGKNDVEKAKNLTNDKVLNYCGIISLNQSVAIIKHSQKVVSSDTGLMHIAAAFSKPILSIWGNTVPEFGMYPYFSDDKNKKNFIFEVADLKCRPCSKLGFHQCPQKHFDCMNKQNVSEIIKVLHS